MFLPEHLKWNKANSMLWFLKNWISFELCFIFQLIIIGYNLDNKGYWLWWNKEACLMAHRCYSPIAWYTCPSSPSIYFGSFYLLAFPDSTIGATLFQYQA
jgi:hypothetical protein